MHVPSVTTGAVGFILSFVFWTSQVLAGNTEDLIRASFRNAIVKIDVSSNNPAFQNGKNVCVSEGTGFVIGPNNVVTADHVLHLAPECGEPIVLLKSRKHNIERLAKIVASRDDVALLKIDEPLVEPLCALRMMESDVYETTGLRFGIPAQFSDAASMVVTIGERQTGFEPLVPLTPVATEFGESGGPIVYQFNVVGILKARHQTYSAYSFMITGSKILSLVQEYKIELGSKACNPVEVKMHLLNQLNVKAELSPSPNLSEPARAEVLKSIKSTLDLQKNNISYVNPTVSTTEKAITIQSNSMPPPLIAMGTIAPPGAAPPTASIDPIQALQQRNSKALSETASSVQRAVGEALWKSFAEEALRERK